jgi:hypothetical protein
VDEADAHGFRIRIIRVPVSLHQKNPKSISGIPFSKFPGCVRTNLLPEIPFIAFFFFQNASSRIH